MFLKTRKTEIVDKDGRRVTLKGVNLGGWLMMEAYFLHAPHFPEQGFKKDFAKHLGPGELLDFEQEYRRHFIQEEDFANIARLGFNCLRVPFNHRLIEKKPYQYDAEGLRLLDQVLRWGKRYKLWIILDLHAAAGSQNHDWHSDSFGKAELWKNKTYQNRTFALWEFLADRYKTQEYLVGYDILNEAVIDDKRILNQFYVKLIKRIRAADPNHIIFVEGNKWAQDLDCLEEFPDNNHALSIHYYGPLEFTFNFVPLLNYPKKGAWDKNRLRGFLEQYQTIARKRGVPIFVGEFGVNTRDGKYGEDQWLKDALDCFRDFGFSWTYWTYKAIKNSIFPDGIFSYRPNPPWVHREGPSMGWDTYHLHWPTQKKEMMASWHTSQFTENKPILETLLHYAK